MMDNFLQHFFPFAFILFDVALCVLFVYKFGKSPTGILGGIGFGLFALSGTARQILMAFGPHRWWEAFSALAVVSLAGKVLLILALVRIPDWIRQASRTPDASGRFHPPAPADAAPGFGAQHPRAFTSPPGQRPGPSPGQTPAPPGSMPGAPITRVEPISTGLFLGGYIGCMVLTLLLSGISFAVGMDHGFDDVVGIALLSLVPAVLLMVLVMVLVYRMWKAIQGGPARTTPGKAMGYLFIPFYNFYWIFQVFHGWTQDYNRLVRERNWRLPQMPEGLALIYCILALVGAVPYVGWILIPVEVVLQSILIYRICQGINGLAGMTAVR